MRRFVVPLFGIALGAALLAWPDASAAQTGAEALQRQSLRPYWYVFIAYALVWILVMGWIVSILRRLGRLERRMEG